MKNSYPRPQFRRSQWTNLNGPWQFAFDDENRGLKDKWYRRDTFPDESTITVPFCVQSEKSGIAETGDHPILWYRRTFETEEDATRKILNFGAVDYRTDVYINGEHVGNHQGGHVSFSFDITDYVEEGQNTLHLRVEDDMHDIEIPRGKQFWKEESENIFYTRTSGIWQTVWLEEVHKTHIERVKIIPDILTNSVKIGYYLKNAGRATLKTTISFKGDTVDTSIKEVTGDYYETVQFLGKVNDQDHKRLWSPEHPNLYDVTFELEENGTKDIVHSYFGMRRISVENGTVMLNNRPYYMRLVLDQGYYPGGLMTSPGDEAIEKDIELTKAMGFNGVRKHQKIEEERYLYYADKMGLLVWEEMPSAYKFSSRMMMNLTDEWQRIVERDYNHPSIIAWVPINESWGVPNLINNPREVNFLESLYNLTKAKDDTRLVISNDGWEHGTTDLLTIHDYESSYNTLKKRYSETDSILSSLPGHRLILNKGFTYDDEPILITEFGGISFKKTEREGWGYSEAHDESDFETRIDAVFSALYESALIQGVCYTQLTDIEQEINGLLTFEREPKIPVETIRKIVRNQ